jgi:hypothetical protein
VTVKFITPYAEYRINDELTATSELELALVQQRLANFIPGTVPLTYGTSVQVGFALTPEQLNDAVRQEVDLIIPPPRTVTTSTTAVNGDVITADSRSGPLTITAPADGSPFTARMPEGLIVGLITIAGNGRTIDAAPTLTSANWGGFVLRFRSIGSTWVYDASYIYGSAA